MAAERPGRNAPCHCGSGRKFKRCCGAAVGAPPPTGEAAEFDRALGSDHVQQWMRARFAGHGVAERQLQFLPRDAGLGSHFMQYARVDLALDPFPYGGVTTTCEALWMGVPVLSLAGDNFASRTGLSILSAIGYPEWAVATQDDYLARATALCRAPARLGEIRAGLRARVAASPMVDAAGFTRALEDALIARWQAHGRDVTAVAARQASAAAPLGAQIRLPI